MDKSIIEASAGKIEWKEDRWVNLDDIVDNSFLIEPKNQCRDITTEESIDLWNDIRKNNKMDAICLKFNSKVKKFVVPSGNHRCNILHCSKELGIGDEVKKLIDGNRLKGVRINDGKVQVYSHIMIGDASEEKSAWDSFAFGYRMNRKGRISSFEKRKVMYFGSLYYSKNTGKQRGYVPFLIEEFNESERDIIQWLSEYNSIIKNKLEDIAKKWNGTDFKDASKLGWNIEEIKKHLDKEGHIKIEEKKKELTNDLSDEDKPVVGLKASKIASIILKNLNGFDSSITELIHTVDDLDKEKYFRYNVKDRKQFEQQLKSLELKLETYDSSKFLFAQFERIREIHNIIIGINSNLEMYKGDSDDIAVNDKLEEIADDINKDTLIEKHKKRMIALEEKMKVRTNAGEKVKISDIDKAEEEMEIMIE